MNPDSPQLYISVEAGPTAPARLAAVLGSARHVAAVLIRPGAAGLTAADAQPLVEMAQKANVAALIEDDASLVRTLRADGVHLSWSSALHARFEEAREILGNRFMIGAGIAPDAPAVRHDAMAIAEAGADYIGFAAGAGQAELVAWWAEIFEVPCVAFDVAGPQLASVLAGARPEFIAITLPTGAAPADCVARVTAVAAAIDDAMHAGAN